jgi:Holliday junction resolvase-like predicted endonuclease
VISPVSAPDRKNENKRNNHNIESNKDTHPPSPMESQDKGNKSLLSYDSKPEPPGKELTREEIRFLADVATRPLSTTVSRYQRLNLSRRRGNAIRQHLAASDIIKAVTVATRSGQVVLYELTDLGRTVCSSAHIETGAKPRESLEHRYWARWTAKYFEKKGYEVTCEHPVKGNGAIDILATRGSRKIAVEVETGKSNIKANLDKIKDAGFDRIVFVATSAAAVSACHKAIDSIEEPYRSLIELLTWLDIS